MNDGINLICTVFVCLALVFLFTGDPDVWDKLHGMVMSGLECKK